MFSKIFRAENTKLHRSFLLYLHLITLFAYPLLLGFYYGGRKGLVAPTAMVITFYKFLAMISPVIISIVICLVFDREEKAGEFKNWLAESGRKSMMIQGQLIYYWLWYVVEILGTSLIFYFILSFIYKIGNISFLKLLITSIAFALLGILQYELAEMIVLKWGIGGSLILGFFGSVISALAITSLFDIIWPIVPWACQVRLMLFWQSGVSRELQIFPAFEYIIPTVITTIFIFLANRYFNNWQGTKSSE